LLVAAKPPFAPFNEIKDIREAKLILGMRIDRDKDRNITLSQKAYTERLLKRFNMSSCLLLTTPLPHGISLSIKDCSSNPMEVEEMKKIPYHEVLGSLMWL